MGFNNAHVNVLGKFFRFVIEVVDPNERTCMPQTFRRRAFRPPIGYERVQERFAPEKVEHYGNPEYAESIGSYSNSIGFCRKSVSLKEGVGCLQRKPDARVSLRVRMNPVQVRASLYPFSAKDLQIARDHPVPGRGALTSKSRMAGGLKQKRPLAFIRLLELALASIAASSSLR